MIKKPLVSGVIIFLNGANFLQEAIESVLAQTYDHWELLLVDDGSTDQSTEIALRYAAQHPGKIRYLEHNGHRNLGKSSSRNLGLRHAKGEYIAFLDHDDIWLPNKLEDQVNILESRPEAGMMYGRTRYWHSWTGRPEDRKRDGFTTLGIQPNTLVVPPHLVTLFLRDERTLASTCSLLVRREIVERIGGFEETFRDQYEDVVFLAKIYLESPVFVSGGCWDCYRQHPDNSCSIAIRTGQWHPKRPNPSREMFLEWLEQYISKKGSTDAKLLETLMTALRSCRHVKERTPRQKFYDVCWDAGVVLGRGDDARPLLCTLGDLRDPELDGHTVAEKILDSWIFDGTPLPSRTTPSIWFKLWHKMEKRIEEFLGALEVQTQAAGLACNVRRVLERMLFIESKWWLRVASGNVANLVFQHNDRETVRIIIKKAETKTSYDVQLNQQRLKVKSNHHYRISFQARADNPRSIFLGFAKAYEPWTNLGLYSKIDLTNEWQDLEQNFVALSDDDNARIHFDVGDSDIPVELSSVCLRSLPDDQIVEPDILFMQSFREKVVKEQPGETTRQMDVQNCESKGIPALVSSFSQLQRMTRQLKSRFDRKAIILMYHRVAEVNTDPWSLCVTPQHFAEHLEIVKKHFCPTSLQHLMKALRKGKVPRRSVVVTFDDGYADNLHNAKPLLERCNVPATVFLSTGYIGQGREFWWDELDRLLLQPGILPGILRLTINRNTHVWELPEMAYYNENTGWQYRNWKAWDDAPNSRHFLYLSLWKLLQPLPESEQREVLDELLVWANSGPNGRLTHRILSQQEVVTLAQGRLVEVGAHTVTHPLLSALPAALQRDEIQLSKASLEKILGHPVTSFAYPYGDYSAETVPIVRDAGFTCSCSTLVGTVGKDTNRFQLPRVTIEDWDGEEFFQRLSKWFHEDSLVYG